MMLADDFGNGDVFLSIVWFTLFFIWIWLLIVVFGDIFRSRDLSGFAKAMWTIAVIVAPYIGVLVYLIVRGHKMGENAEQAVAQQDAAARAYIQSVAGSGKSPAEEIAQLVALRDNGAISEEEFQQAKAKALG